MQQNILNQIFKTQRQQEKMILSSRMYEKIYNVYLKEFLKLFKCLASSGVYMISGWLDLLFKALEQEKKI